MVNMETMRLVIANYDAVKIPTFRLQFSNEDPKEDGFYIRYAVKPLREIHFSFYKDHKYVGFMKCEVDLSKVFRINLVVIYEQFRRRGYGYEMMKNLIAFITLYLSNVSRCELRADRDNTSAISLYSKVGFSIDSIDTQWIIMSIKI